MAYDDIMVKYPQMIPQLPRGLIAVAWYYTSEDPTYKRWLGPLIAHHIPHVVQPGVMSYDNIAPDFDTTFENIDTFLAAGRGSGALGLDQLGVGRRCATAVSHVSSRYCVWRSCAVAESPHGRASFFSDYSRQMYPATIARGPCLGIEPACTQAETVVQKVLGKSNRCFACGRIPSSQPTTTCSPAHREDLHEARMHAERSRDGAASCRRASVWIRQTVNSLMIGSELLDYAGEKFQAPLDLSAIWDEVRTNTS